MTRQSVHSSRYLSAGRFVVMLVPGTENLKIQMQSPAFQRLQI